MNPPLELKWVKCQKNQWCSFHHVDVSFVTTHGVYVIWFSGTPGTPGRVVYIGHGKLSAHIQALRANPNFRNYAKHGTLYVTWASVSEEYREGVARYLVEKWSPLGADAQLSSAPIAVNSPW
ncbi:MAG: hypothetical protein ACLPXB_06640 [Thiobacillaceae bacterium]|jgi:hypothetical protein